MTEHKHPAARGVGISLNQLPGNCSLCEAQCKAMFKNQWVDTPAPPCATCPKFNLWPEEKGGVFGLHPANLEAWSLFDMVREPIVQGMGAITGAMNIGNAMSIIVDFNADKFPDFESRRVILKKLRILDSVQTSAWVKDQQRQLK